MELYSFENVAFTYPDREQKALFDLNFQVHRGEFLILCGPSGCGKSTLLRQLKSCMAPHGRLSGEIRYCGALLSQWPQREQAQQIGYVLQSPENQVVTDKVWHELAFGLESLGYDTPTIRRRVAEIAAFFGIENWFYKDVTELSGGQKQLLSLASVMAMQPEVLVLDEPTSNLDPIGTESVFMIIDELNKKEGMTIILVEHEIELMAQFVDRFIVLDEGQVILDGTPEEVYAREELLRSANLTIPLMVEVAAKLRQQGIDVPSGIITEEKMVEFICQYK